MKVIVHALDFEPNGKFHFLPHFLKALSSSKSILNEKPHYWVIVGKDQETPPSTSNISIIKIPRFLSSNFWGRLFLDGLALPVYFLIKRGNALVTLSPAGPIWGVKNRVNFQINPIYFSKGYLSQLTLKEKMKFLIKKFLVFWGVKTSEKIIVPSQSMLSEVLSAFPDIEPEKFILFPLAVESPPVEVSRISNQLVSITSNAPLTFFYPCRGQSHKGFEILFRALGKLKRIHGVDFRCLLTTRLEDLNEEKTKLSIMIRQEQIEKEVVFLGSITPEERDYLYRNSTAVVFPSYLESFSYPLAEALSFSLPSVAADTPLNREICQNGALYYPPFDSEAMATLLKSLMDLDLRKRLSKEAKSQFESRDWTWASYIREFEKLL